MELVSINERAQPCGALTKLGPTRIKSLGRAATWNPNVVGCTFVVACSAASTVCVSVYNARYFVVEAPPQILVPIPPRQDEELSASDREELASALSNVLEFHPEPERVTDRDLERNLPSYHFPE